MPSQGYWFDLQGSLSCLTPVAVAINHEIITVNVKVSFVYVYLSVYLQ